MNLQNRSRVKRLWALLKQGHAVAIRCEKTATSFSGVLCVNAALDWLNRWRALEGHEFA